jgi:hypothetical protein
MRHLTRTLRDHHYEGRRRFDGIVWTWSFLIWDSSSFGRFLEMRSAFTEVRAIREDLNARRRKGEHPENRCYESALCRWHDAIAALAECLYSRKSALLVADLSALHYKSARGKRGGLGF